jgi:peptidoglycan/LPS O-acetylase OafA/YrhL
MIACAVVTLLLLLVCEGAGRWIPFYARLMRTPLRGFGAIEGLRGFLAVAVFFHHAELTRNLVQVGKWGLGSQAFLFLGRAGVSCFFMITALLFWTKVLAADGKLDFVSLYRSRLRRIVPMYEFYVACILAGVAWSSKFTLRVPLQQLVDTTGAWAAFAVCGFPDVNGVPYTRLIGAGVHWTLMYEWAFYAALPLLAVFRKGIPFAFMLVGCWFCFVHLGLFAEVQYFLVGMVVATALRFKAPPAAVRHPAAGALALLLVVLSGSTLQFRQLTLSGIAMMGLFFYIVAAGNTLGGLLVSRPARVLGTISYSLYLMQGIVLFAVRSVMSLKGATPEKIWLYFSVCGVALVLVSLATYRWIEHPFLAPRTDTGPAPAPRPAEPIAAVPTLEPPSIA